MLSHWSYGVPNALTQATTHSTPTATASTAHGNRDARHSTRVRIASAVPTGRRPTPERQRVLHPPGRVPARCATSPQPPPCSSRAPVAGPARPSPRGHLDAGHLSTPSPARDEPHVLDAAAPTRPLRARRLRLAPTVASARRLATAAGFRLVGAPVVVIHGVSGSGDPYFQVRVRMNRALPVGRQGVRANFLVGGRSSDDAPSPFGIGRGTAAYAVGNDVPDRSARARQAGVEGAR